MRVFFVNATTPHVRPCPLAVAAGAYDARTLDQRYRPFADHPGYEVARSVDEADLISNGIDVLKAGSVEPAMAMGSARPRAWYDLSDDEHPSPDALRGIVWRPGLVRGKVRPNERAMPGLCVEAVEGSVPEPLKRGRPRVAFCGHVAPWHLRLAMAITRRRNPIGHRLRARAIKAVERSGLETDFVTRTHYHGGETFQDAQHRMRRDFLRNLHESPYALCVRGYGNYSLRFYEAFSAGRIPLLIDTDCVLPFDDLVPYAQRCVIVPLAELSRVGDHVRAFHESHTDDSFRDLQRENRRTWETVLAPRAMLDLTVQRTLEASARLYPSAS